jgi:hypothetical protein
MSIIARQSTAFETAIGPVLDADGVAVTDCVVGDFKLKKTTGNFAALNGSATLTHVSAGMYDLVLTTSDTDTVGVCVVAIDDTTNACHPLYLQVVEEVIYDALFAASATGLLPANVTQWLGSAAATPTVAGVPEVDITHYGGSAGTFASGRPEVNTTHWKGAAAATVDTAGYPVVTIKDGTGQGEILTTSGKVDSVQDVQGSVSGNVNGNVAGSVGSVLGDVGGAVIGAVGSIATGGIAAASFAASAIDAAALASDAANEIADATLDRANGIETGFTLRQAFRIVLAALGGKLSGAATTTVTIRDAADAKARITATVDADGNRSAVTLDAT